MPAFHPYGSTAVVDIPDESVEAYTAQGWTAVKAAAETKKQDAKPSAKK